MIVKAIVRFFLFFIILMFSTVSYAAEVTMAWDASSGDPAGYRIYFGTSPGVYSGSVDVGNVTEHTLSGLEADVTYYFVVRAYNDDGESGNSNEVSWIYETADTQPPVVSVSGPGSVSDPVINLSGTASDNRGVDEVRWINDRGGSGVAQGTSNWTITGISLSEGENVITVSARDAAGNDGSADIPIFYSLSGDVVIKEFGNSTNADYTGTVEDTYTNAGNSDVNSSTNNERLIIYTWPDSTNANPVLIKWDLSSMPSNASIQSANLQLYMDGFSDSGGDNSYEISVHKIINHDPDISQCTWSTYDGVNSWTGGANGGLNDVAAANDTKMVDKSVGYKQWDVTQMVTDWVDNPASNYGMMLLSDQGANQASADTNRIFVPTENADAGKRPKLVVTYLVSGEMPTPEPPTAPVGLRVISP